MWTAEKLTKILSLQFTKCVRPRSQASTVQNLNISVCEYPSSDFRPTFRWPRTSSMHRWQTFRAATIQPRDGGDRSHAKTKINHRRQQRTLSSRRRENPIKYTLQVCNWGTARWSIRMHSFRLWAVQGLHTFGFAGLLKSYCGLKVIYCRISPSSFIERWVCVVSDEVGLARSPRGNRSPLINPAIAKNKQQLLSCASSWRNARSACIIFIRLSGHRSR